MTRFYKIYLTVIILFLIALSGFLVYLNWQIEAYSETLPEAVSKKYFESVFKNIDPDGLNPANKLFPVSRNEFDTDRDMTDILEYRKEVILASTYTETSRNENSILYTITSNGNDIGTFTLEKDENGVWQGGNITVEYEPRYTVTVKALSSSTVYLNGKPVSMVYKVANEPHPSKDYLPEEVPSPEYITYKIENCIKEPKISIKDRNGTHTTAVREGDIFVEKVIYAVPDQSISARIVDTAINIELHKKHLVPLSLVTPYIEEGTALYREVEENDDKTVNEKYEIRSNVSIFEFFEYDENTVSLRIAFTLATSSGEESVDVTYFARKINGEYFIYTYKNNSEAVASESLFLLEK